MRIRWRMVGSAALSLLAGLVVYLHVSRLDQREAVVVAAGSVPAGQVLGPGDLRVVMLPRDAVHPRALREATDGIGRVTTVDLVAGEQVLAGRTRPPEQAGVGWDLPPYLRAMLLPVPVERAGGGIASPGRLVDVVFVSDDPGQPALARVLARGVKVLAVRDERGQPWTPGRELPMGVVVAVTVEQAQKLAFALEHGSLYLVLCPPDAQPAGGYDVTWQNMEAEPLPQVPGAAPLQGEGPS